MTHKQGPSGPQTERQLTERQLQMEALRILLRELEKQEIEAVRARLAAVKAVWAFSLERVDVPSSWDRLRDGCGVDVYTLRGTVLNREECEVAGHDVSRLAGAMNYWFNTLNGKFIRSCGSGHVFINEGAYTANAAEAREDAELVFRKLEEFLLEHPKGGDVTAIIKLQRHNGWF